mmetsp:Transcript_36621/g.73816  ORF Transcript_36621/g.73816 Transcript_36621/m.73816 type:complete len:218 (+) Transcript_36621:354-1007(+)
MLRDERHELAHYGGQLHEPIQRDLRAHVVPRDLLEAAPILGLEVVAVRLQQAVHVRGHGHEEALALLLQAGAAVLVEPRQQHVHVLLGDADAVHGPGQQEVPEGAELLLALAFQTDDPLLFFAHAARQHRREDRGRELHQLRVHGEGLTFHHNGDVRVCLERLEQFAGRAALHFSLLAHFVLVECHGAPSPDRQSDSAAVAPNAGEWEQGRAIGRHP